jgi:hypothetical protein
VDLWDLTKMMGRRWYVAVPMVLLTIVASVAAYLLVKPQYQATNYLQLIPAPSPVADADRLGRVHNPWDDLGEGRLATAAQSVVMSQDTAKKMHDRGLSTVYTVSMPNGAPPIEVQATAATQDLAIATADAVMTLLDQAVLAKQTAYNIAPQDTITTLRLNSTFDVTTVTTSTKRALIVAAGIGLLLTFGATIMVDAVLRRRDRDNDSAAAAAGLVMPRLAYDRPGGPPGAGNPRTQAAFRSEDRTHIAGSPLAGAASTSVTMGQPERAAPQVDYQSAADRPSVSVTRSAPAPAAARAPHDGAAPVDEYDRPDTTIVLPLSNSKWSSKSDKSGR